MDEQTFNKLKKFVVVEIRRKFSISLGDSLSHAFGGLVIKKGLKDGIDPDRIHILCLWGVEPVNSIGSVPLSVWRFRRGERTLESFDTCVVSDLSDTNDIRLWPEEVMGVYLEHLAKNIGLRYSLSEGKSLETLQRKIVAQHRSLAIAEKPLPRKNNKASVSQKRRMRHRRIKTLKKLRIANKISGVNPVFLDGNSEYLTTETHLVSSNGPHCKQLPEVETMAELTSIATLANPNAIAVVLQKISTKSRKPHINGYCTLNGANVRPKRNSSINIADYFVFVREKTCLGKIRTAWQRKLTSQGSSIASSLSQFVIQYSYPDGVPSRPAIPSGSARSLGDICNGEEPVTTNEEPVTTNVNTWANEISADFGEQSSPAHGSMTAEVFPALSWATDATTTTIVNTTTTSPLLPKKKAPVQVMGSVWKTVAENEEEEE